MNKRKHINLGVPEDQSDLGPMLVAEGSRHNFIPGEPFTSESCSATVRGAELVGTRIHRIFSAIREPLWVFKVGSENSFCISLTVPVDPGQRCFTFSTFADTTEGSSILLKVMLSNSVEIKCDYFLVTGNLTRFELPFEFAKSSNSIKISIEGPNDQSNNDAEVEIGFGCLTLEEGLFPTSLILSSATGGFRDGSQLSFQRERNFFTGQAGTITFFFSPQWTGPQLDSEHSAFLFDCVSDDRRNSISIYADGSDYGKLKVDINNNGQNFGITSEIIPVRGALYAVALRWFVGELEFLINGRSVGRAVVKFPKSKELGDRVYIGSTPRSASLGAFSYFQVLKSFKGWQSDAQIRSELYAAFPLKYPHYFLDWQRQKFPLRTRYFSSGSWAGNMAGLMLRLPIIWQESPPAWLKGDLIDEADCRDEIHRYFRVLDWDSIPEFFSEEGRTDLLIKVPDETKQCLRIEFKVWGRHDYKDVPEKPLKYFTDAENKGAVVMINPNLKKDIGIDYRQNVAGSDTGFKDLVNQPFAGEGVADHFISIHESARGKCVEVLHMIFNRFGPFSEKAAATMEK